MSIEKVEFDIKVFDGYVEIIPKNGVLDNSIYEINLNGIEGINGESYFGENKIKITTELNPMYCIYMDVSSLLDIVDIPEEIVLYNIREASRYASYIYETSFPGKKIDKRNIPFAIKEFTRYKAAKDCMLKLYMSLIADNVIEGDLGEVRFKTRDQLPDIKKLLDYLDEEIKKWQDAIRGYDIEGRAKMKTAIRGYHHGGKNHMTSLEKRSPHKSVPIGMNRGVY